MYIELKPCSSCGGEAHSVSTPHGNGDMVQCSYCYKTGQKVMYGGDVNGEYTSRYWNKSRILWNIQYYENK